MYNKVADIYCKDPNLLLAVFKEMTESGIPEEEALTRLHAFCPTKRAALYLRNALPISWNNIFICKETRNSKDPSDTKEIEKYIKWLNSFSNMKFDYVIQNPPYSGNLYLDFIKKGVNIMSEEGRMVFIVPATWLINILKTGDAKLYDAIKQPLEGHIETIAIENRDKDFNTGLKVPFATVIVDMSKTFKTINFINCGEKKIVKSIYDCNLIGDYATIWSILSKVQNFRNGDMMKDHTTKKVIEGDVWYAKYPRIISANFCGGGDGRFNSDEMYRKHAGKDYYLAYTAPGFHSDRTSDIQNYPCEKRDKGGKKIEGSIAENIYGTKEELENWKYFIFNNKLPLFINIALTYCQDNHSKPYLPWLVDRKYTDEEINKLFGFTEEEIALIDRTTKKYERNSPWFKRYMCGPDSVSDEEVMEFIKTL